MSISDPVREMVTRPLSWRLENETHLFRSPLPFEEIFNSRPGRLQKMLRCTPVNGNKRGPAAGPDSMQAP